VARALQLNNNYVVCVYIPLETKRRRHARKAKAICHSSDTRSEAVSKRPSAHALRRMLLIRDVTRASMPERQRLAVAVFLALADLELLGATADSRSCSKFSPIGLCSPVSNDPGIFIGLNTQITHLPSSRPSSPPAQPDSDPEKSNP
jgi:hypothetical protein